VLAELEQGLSGLLGTKISESPAVTGSIVLAGNVNSPDIKKLNLDSQLEKLGNEGFLILTTTYQKKKLIVIAAQQDIGVLYGTFHFLKLLQTHQPIDNLNIESSPRINLRVLNHWDNLDRTVERGYAGFSLWDWHKLPGYIDPRYHDYARANASIGINGTVVTNVNANARVLSAHYLEKVAALADVF